MSVGQTDLTNERGERVAKGAPSERTGFPPSTTMMNQPCIICGKTAEIDRHMIRYNVMLFTSPGGYGSNYDPVSNRRSLVITLCDECVENKARDGFVQEVTRTPVPDKYEYQDYNPDARE